MIAEPPLVSVVLPVKNGERFLAQAIQSVLDQDYRPLEIVVVDGQSTDASPQIARSYEGVRYVLQSGELGLSRARNLGIAESRCDYIAFINCDDLWEPAKLSAQVRYLLRHPEAQAVVTRATFFLEPGCSVPPGFRSALLEGDYMALLPEALLARRSLFDRLGGFDETLTICDDIDWFARAQDENVTVAVLPDVLVHRRVHDSNLAYRRSSAKAVNAEMLQALKRSIARKRSPE
jgi:glycosyltransferase involved in cell wall biosynthesis